MEAATELPVLLHTLAATATKYMWCRMNWNQFGHSEGPAFICVELCDLFVLTKAMDTSATLYGWTVFFLSHTSAVPVCACCVCADVYCASIIDSI